MKSSEELQKTPYLLGVLPCAALILLLLADWIVSGTLHSHFAQILGIARDIGTFSRAVALLIFSVVVSSWPKIINERILTFVSVICIVLGSALILIALQLSSASMLTAGTVLSNIGRAWVVLIVSISFLRLTLHQACLFIAVSFLICNLLKSLFYLCPLPVLYFGFAFFPLIALFLAGTNIKDSLRSSIWTKDMATLYITNPSSFLPLQHQLFICIFLFQLAHGCALSFNETDGQPIFTILPVAPLAAVTLYIAFKKSAINFDAVFKLAALLMIAGFLLMLPQLNGFYGVANNVLMSGAETFSLLATLVLVSVSTRNTTNAINIFAWGFGLYYAGIPVGAFIGRWANSLLALEYNYFLLMVIFVVLSLVAYVILILGNFSFTTTILAVEQAKNLTPLNENTSIEHACNDIANRFLLTSKETEILNYLARGRNVPYIQEKLVISQNTVKAHVKHIYSKLNIHSQQELIDLVEEKSLNTH